MPAIKGSARRPMGLVPRRPGRPRSAPLSAAPSGLRAPRGRSPRGRRRLAGLSPHLSRPARHTPLLTGPPPASIQGTESTDEPRSAGAARTCDIRGVPFDFPVTRALVSVVTISTFLLSVSVHCPLRAERCSPRWEHGGEQPAEPLSAKSATRWTGEKTGAAPGAGRGARAAGAAPGRAPRAGSDLERSPEQ